MVSSTQGAECSSSTAAPSTSKVNSRIRDTTRTSQKQKVASTGLEDLWIQRLVSEGWSVTAAQTFVERWASSTRRTYSHKIHLFKEFCSDREINVFMAREKHVAEFLLSISQQSTRPKGVVVTTVSALAHFYQALGVKTPMTDRIHALVQGIVKVRTQEPMCKSSVLPLDGFRRLFRAWGVLPASEVERLHAKAITLMALSLMLRPSDIAPRSAVATASGTVS